MAAEEPAKVSSPRIRGRRARLDLTTPGLIGPPVAWLVLFFLVPVCIAAAYSVGALSFFPGEENLSLNAWRDFLDGSATSGCSGSPSSWR